MSRRSVFLGIFAVMSSACGAGAGSVCARLDECNFLAAGYSVGQCTEDAQATLDNMTPSVRTDCLSALDDAVASATCDVFAQNFGRCPIVQ